MIGATLDHFRITAKLGEGGMGEVYRAEDTRLAREVAIKVLPEAFVADADRVARFEREAKVLASLNHSRIAGIYEVGEVGGVHYLVMELAEGEILQRRMARGPVPVAEALPIALQIAEALEAAHARGIVHRDLKPGNVMADGEGNVKVLDFGLAKALEPEPGPAAAAGLTRSPTLTYRATQAGMLLGTAAYMSPEQARGKPADERCDLWALGVVLWEMLTGRRLFAGETVSDTLASVLKEEPDWSELPAATPPAVRRLLRRCLRKDPKERLHHTADARLELQEAISEEDTPGSGGSAPGAAPRHRFLPWALVALLAAVLAAAAWRLSIEAPRRHHDQRLSVLCGDGVQLGIFPSGSNVALSDDGRRLVYLAFEQDQPPPRLYLRELDDFETRALPGTEGASVPFFSPDGRWLGFFADGKLKKMPVGGGTPRTICDALEPRGADWGEDGFIVYSTLQAGGLLRVSAGGGSPEQITTVDSERGEMGHRHPQVLPGSSAVLFTVLREGVTGAENRAVKLLHLPSGEIRTLVEGGMQARSLGMDVLVWALPDQETMPAPGTLMGAAFDPRAGKLVGPPVPLVEGVSTMPLFATAHYAVAAEGSMVYLPARSMAFSLAWVAPGGDPELLPLEPRQYANTPTLSPDGSRIALTVVQDGAAEIWIYHREVETLHRLTFDGRAANPTWSPDGRFVTYTDAEGGFSRKLAHGGEPAQQILAPEALPPFPFPGSWSADGELLAFTSKPAATSFDLWIADFSGVASGSGEPELRSLLATPAQELPPVFAPRGRWLAYTSDASGRPEVYVVDVARPEARRQVSSGGGGYPVWDREGEELFYLWDEQVFAVDVSLGETLTIGRSRSLGSIPSLGGRGLELGPAGERFLMLLPAEAEAAEEIRVVLGWADEVRRTLGRELDR